jgi:hypothetical protein
MAYKLKSDKVIVEGDENLVVAKPLPQNPSDGYFTLDIADSKYKVYHKGRWVVLGSVESELGGTPVVLNTEKLNFNPIGFSVTQDGTDPSKVNISVNQILLPGKLIDFVFGNVGNTQNKWLLFSSSSAPSDELPYVAPYDGELVGLTFANTNDNVGADFDIYVNGSILYTWQVRNKRTAYKTNLPSGLTISQGERISIFAKKIGGQGTPSTPILEIIFQVQSAPIAEGGTQFGV